MVLFAFTVKMNSQCKEEPVFMLEPIKEKLCVLNEKQKLEGARGGIGIRVSLFLLFTQSS